MTAIGGGIQQAAEAARRAAEEAARRAAEEAAKKAAEEAARRAAEEAANEQAQAAADAAKTASKHDKLSASGSGLDGYKTDGSPAEKFKAEHSVAYSQLPAEQQQKLDQVVNKLCDYETQQDRLCDRTHEDLGHLLNSGALKQKDATGKTIIDHLAARADQPLHPQIAEGLNGSQQNGAIHDLIHSVAHPESINQGEGTYTCTTAVVQTLLAVSYPADYVGMTAGLLYDGVGRTPTGEAIKLDTTELYENEIGRRTGRGITDAVFQGSLLTYAQQSFPADGGKGVTGGRFSASYTFGGGRFSRSVTFGGEQQGGLTSTQVGGLLDKVLGIKTQDIEVTAGNRDQAFSMFTTSLSVARDSDNKGMGARERRALQNGIPVGVETQDGRFHEILVTDARDGKVFYMDPVDGKTHDMDEGEFKERLRAIKVPAGAPSRFLPGGTGDLQDIPDQKVLYGKLFGLGRLGGRAVEA
ncbi:MAG: hypothetical protein FJZ01_11790 [Candidatus Sericytochromatia bacterium]|nr:hypothetical protein [Candidatus Tanganyikabacteria bacterium]